MSTTFRAWLPTGLTTIGAFLFGLSLVSRPPAMAYSGGNDRYGESITATGSILVQVDHMKNPVPLDAVYHLDYSGARLLASIPSMKQSSGVTNLIDGFAERDLAADFKLTSGSPHFQMTTGSLGAQAAGLSVLYVFETTTKQLGIYRLTPQMIGGSGIPKFELLQLKSYAAKAPRS